MTNKFTLHVATYLVPSISVEFFESLLQYLEQKLVCRTSLVYESRSEGPPSDGTDLFTGDHAFDIAFMSANGYLAMKQNEEASFQLLPISTLHTHEKNTSGSPAVFLDVVVNKNMKEMQSIHDLKGVRWAHNTCDRITSAVTLLQLKSIGVSATFFSNVLKSRSHLDSLRMILQRKAHASAVDSNALQMFLRENPNERSELFSIATWGPLPHYAIVVRRTLDPKVRDAVSATLLEMHETSEGREILSSFKIKRFAIITEDDLITGEEYIQATKGLSFDTVYY